MFLRYLFGPVNSTFAEQNLWQARATQQCLTFDFADADVSLAGASRWEDVQGSLPQDWQPDFLVLYLPYRTIPEWLWQAPLPIVGLAGDWNLLWHYYRRQLRSCELVLTDALGVETMTKEGITHVRQANLFGGERSFQEAEWPAADRDIDVLFVGNMSSAVQGDRLPWLGRLAALAERWNIVIETGVFGADYRKLLARARIVFNRSIRGEWNNRVFEAVSAGALLFQEADNREVPLHLRDRKECVLYTAENLEQLLHYYLEHEDERRAIAEAARSRVNEFSFANLWQEQVAVIENELPALRERMARRAVEPPADRLLTRSWQTLSTIAPDAALHEELQKVIADNPRNASLANAMGVIRPILRAGDQAESMTAFQEAWLSDPAHLVAGLNLAECLHLLGRKPDAIQQAQRALALLERVHRPDEAACDDPHFPTAYDDFRVQWERAAWLHAGDKQAEAQAKLRLLRWRLHALLAAMSDDLVHYYEACELQPELAFSQSALAAALSKRGRFFEAAIHLEKALAANPFDVEAARSLFNVLGEMGNSIGQQRLVRQRRLLSKAAPKVAPSESWFADRSPAIIYEANCDAKPLHLVWEGSQLAVHSLALVNREICSRLLARGHDLSLLPPRLPESTLSTVTGYEDLAACMYKPLAQPADVHIAHQWPPSFEPPLEGHWVIIQPWEFGSLPLAWIQPMRDLVDEVWVPSHFVRDCFIKSGLPSEQVHVVPNGVHERFFAATRGDFALQTKRSFKFLFVGGTIHRKGIDVLLRAYGQTFSADDDVCLVIKDMGGGTFYQGQTAQRMVSEFREQAHAPEVEYLDRELSDDEMASLYATCNCLVHPYRGEGFGLPIAEAMAVGLPVIVTGYGAALDYCNEKNAFLVPARVQRFREKRIDNEPAVDFPWLAEPDQDMLRYLLRHVFAHRDEAQRMGQIAREDIRRGFTWERTVALVEKRLNHLRNEPIRRLRQAPVSSPLAKKEGQRVSLCLIVKNEEANIGACLQSAADVVDEIIVVDTGSTDRTKEIAASTGAKVFDFPWVDSFAAARNECLNHATCEWIFWMDADDRLDDANRHKLRTLFANLPDDNVAYVMKCLCVPDPETKTATEVDHVRLFRNHPQIRWTYRVHEQILPAVRELGGHVQRSDVVIEHVGYLDKALRMRKRQRDLRLLMMQNDENPNEPFTLFNLAAIYQEQGEMQKALAVLRRSLELSHPTDSIVRKLYAMIAYAHCQLGQYREALAACQEGRRHYPNDAELQFHEGLSWKSLGDKNRAISCFERLLTSRESDHFASVATGLRGYKARHNLATLYQEVGRSADAEQQWLQALNEQPAFIPALQGMVEVYITLQRWRDADAMLAKLAAISEASLDATVLRARLLAAQEDFTNARRLLDQAISLNPSYLYPRVVLTHVLLQEGKDWQAAEEALRNVLRLDPNNAEAKRNLSVLLNQLGKPPE